MKKVIPISSESIDSAKDLRRHIAANQVHNVATWLADNIVEKSPHHFVLKSNPEIPLASLLTALNTKEKSALHYLFQGNVISEGTDKGKYVRNSKAQNEMITLLNEKYAVDFSSFPIMLTTGNGKETHFSELALRLYALTLYDPSPDSNYIEIALKCRKNLLTRTTKDDCEKESITIPECLDQDGKDHGRYTAVNSQWAGPEDEVLEYIYRNGLKDPFRNIYDPFSWSDYVKLNRSPKPFDRTDHNLITIWSVRKATYASRLDMRKVEEELLRCKKEGRPQDEKNLQDMIAAAKKEDARAMLLEQELKDSRSTDAPVMLLTPLIIGIQVCPTAEGPIFVLIDPTADSSALMNWSGKTTLKFGYGTGFDTGVLKIKNGWAKVDAKTFLEFKFTEP